MPDTKIHTIYKLADGTRIPSVTTYLGILAKPALIHWAWELGVQGLDYRKVRDQAGDIGTLVHYLIICKLKGEEPDLSTYTPQDAALAASPMSKFEEWFEEHEIEPVLMETPLVSEEYKFGGTPDFYGLIDKQATLLDFKTGKEVYQETFYQLAAYTYLLIENGYAPVESVRVLRIGKSEDEGFDYRTLGNLDNYWKVFLACQEIYELNRSIRKANKSDSR